MDKMVRIPVKFRESLNISNEMKTFIKKCLEVNEDARMSLNDLKEWNSKNSVDHIPEDLPVKKTASHQESGVQVLREVTNKQSARSQSSLNYNSKQARNFESKQSSKNNMSQEENK